MNSNINPMQLIQMVQNSPNPQYFVLNMLEQYSNVNPFFMNLLKMAKEGRTRDIEQVAQNMMCERGLDFNKEFTKFKNSLGLYK